MKAVDLRDVYTQSYVWYSIYLYFSEVRFSTLMPTYIVGDNVAFMYFFLYCGANFDTLTSISCTTKLVVIYVSIDDNNKQIIIIFYENSGSKSKYALIEQVPCSVVHAVLCIISDITGNSSCILCLTCTYSAWKNHNIMYSLQWERSSYLRYRPQRTRHVWRVCARTYEI